MCSTGSSILERKGHAGSAAPGLEMEMDDVEGKAIRIVEAFDRVRDEYVAWECSVVTEGLRT